MAQKDYFLKLGVAISAIILAFINYKQGNKSIVTFMNDNDVILSKEAVLNRIFVNTDFFKLDYMEGNSVFHFISPFLFFSLSVFCGSYTFLRIKKNYHQFLHSRTKYQRISFKIIRSSYISMTLFFNSMYIFSVIFLIYINNLQLCMDFKELVLLGFMMFLSSSLISLGISSISFYFYLKYDEIISLLISFLLISILFILDLKLRYLSIIFINDHDKYFIGGIITGVVLILISYILNKNVKYEIT